MSRRSLRLIQQSEIQSEATKSEEEIREEIRRDLGNKKNFYFCLILSLLESLIMRRVNQDFHPFSRGDPCEDSGRKPKCVRWVQGDIRIYRRSARNSQDQASKREFEKILNREKEAGKVLAQLCWSQIRPTKGQARWIAANAKGKHSTVTDVNLNRYFLGKVQGRQIVEFRADENTSAKIDQSRAKTIPDSESRRTAAKVAVSM